MATEETTKRNARRKKLIERLRAENAEVRELLREIRATIADVVEVPSSEQLPTSVETTVSILRSLRKQLTAAESKIATYERGHHG